MRLLLLVIMMGLSYLLSALSFLGKGIVLDDAYVFASKEARKTMDREAYLRQSGWIFLGMGTMFLCYCLGALLRFSWGLYAAVGVAAGTAVYTVVSHYALRKRKN